MRPVYWFLHHQGTAYTLWPHEVGHRPAPGGTMAHCNSVRSDNCSEDFTLVPYTSQCAVGYDIGVCVTLQGYATPDHSVNHAVSRLLHVCHMCSEWSCSHLWMEDLPIMVFSHKCQLSCMVLAVSKGPTRGPHGTIMKSAPDSCKYHLILPVVTRTLANTLTQN